MEESPWTEIYAYCRQYQAEHLYVSVWSCFSNTNATIDFSRYSGLESDTLVYKDHWGEHPVYIDLPLGNLTWGQLYKAADEAIKRSKDTHHLFIESFEKDPTTGYIKLHTGS